MGSNLRCRRLNHRGTEAQRKHKEGPWRTATSFHSDFLLFSSLCLGASVVRSSTHFACGIATKSPYPCERAGMTEPWIVALITVAVVLVVEVLLLLVIT